jgi:hypothetical protein
MAIISWLYHIQHRWIIPVHYIRNPYSLGSDTCSERHQACLPASMQGLIVRISHWNTYLPIAGTMQACGDKSSVWKVAIGYNGHPEETTFFNSRRSYAVNNRGPKPEQERTLRLNIEITPVESQGCNQLTPYCCNIRIPHSSHAFFYWSVKLYFHNAVLPSHRCHFCPRPSLVLRFVTMILLCQIQALHV